MDANDKHKHTLAVKRLRSSLSDAFVDSLDNSMLNKLVEKEIALIEKEFENEAMKQHASQRDADFALQSQMFLEKEQELAAMHQRLASLELHRERVRSSVEWMREVDAKKTEQKFMTSVSHDKPKR